jgi:hypothetical protein
LLLPDELQNAELYMDQQGWSILLEGVAMIGLDEVKYLSLIEDDGTLVTKPMMYHLLVFRGTT